MVERPADWERWFLDQKEVYRQILDAIADMVLVKGEKSRMLWANKAFRDYYGMSNEELRAIIDAPFNEVDYTEQYVRDDLQVYSTGETLDIPEEPVTRHDGLVQIFHTVKSPLRDQGGEVRMTVGLSRNITEQKRTKEDLARYREHLERLVQERTAELSSLSERLQIILASLAEGIVAVDAEGRVQRLNPAAEMLTGLNGEQAAGHDLSEVLQFTPESSEGSAGTASQAESALTSLFRSNRSVAGHLRSAGGTQRLVSVHASPLIGDSGAYLGSVLVLRDIALEREVAEQRLRRQKLESLGLLAGGLAHDFNNLLTIILGSISLARLGQSRGEPIEDVLTDAEKACIRAQGLTTQLLTFAKGGAPVKKVLQVGGPVRQAAELALRGSAVKLQLDCALDVHLIEADEGQLAQVINNLVLNAKQAMPDGGQVTISIANAELSEMDPLPLEPGPCVVISVSDCGMGIPGDHLPHVFDPYFTTKERGSGLGLASVHSIIQRHGGHVTVCSSLGNGACFTIYLPAVYRQEATASVKPLAARMRTCLRLLVLDDDEAVRQVTVAILAYLGHRVIATGKSADTLAAYNLARDEGDPFDVVFVDLTMPGDLDGAVVADRLRSQNPGVRVVVMSGHSTDSLMANAQEFGFVGALQKPFTLEMVREILAKC